MTCNIHNCCACQPQKLVLDKLILVSVCCGAKYNFQMEKNRLVLKFGAAHASLDSH